MPSIALVIPARLGSTRLPRKALADIAGKPMVVRVLERAARVSGASRLLVATDAEEIKTAVEKAGFEAVLTPPSLASGTDRVAFVAKDLRDDIVVNVQGDEPRMPVAAIEAAIEPVRAGETPMGSCMTPFLSMDEMLSPNQVKVLVDSRDRALWFSRYPIPYPRQEWGVTEVLAQRTLGRHLGIYCYRREFLLQFAALPPSFAERRESLEQLRALHHGFSIGMGRVDEGCYGVDTVEDLDRVRALFLDGASGSMV